MKIKTLVDKPHRKKLFQIFFRKKLQSQSQKPKETLDCPANLFNESNNRPEIQFIYEKLSHTRNKILDILFTFSQRVSKIAKKHLN